MTGGEMRAELHRSIAAAGGLCAWAKARGLSHTSVSLQAAGHREISEEVANALGFIRETTFRRIAGQTS